MTEENEKDYRINFICRFCEKEKKINPDNFSDYMKKINLILTLKLKN